MYTVKIQESYQNYHIHELYAPLSLSLYTTERKRKINPGDIRTESKDENIIFV